MFRDEIKELIQERRKFRIYGNTLGATHDIISFLYVLERNYNILLLKEKMIIGTIKNRPQLILTKEDYDEAYRKFDKIYKTENIQDRILEDEYLIINKISFNSPGFWEVIGSLNPLNQIREYIQEWHMRKRDNDFLELDKEFKGLENEKKKLENDILKLDITQRMIIQLKDIGFSNEEINPIIEKCYVNLELLNTHIDAGRITDMEII